MLLFFSYFADLTRLRVRYSRGCREDRWGKMSEFLGLPFGQLVSFSNSEME